MEHNVVKNPNWLEANKLPEVFCKRGRGLDSGPLKYKSNGLTADIH